MTEHTRSKYTNQRDGPSDLIAHRTLFDPETDRVSEELVCAVGEFTGTEPRELPILSDVIDPDALDSLFRYHSDEAHDVLAVEFEYGGFLARVSSEGRIEFRSS